MVNDPDATVRYQLAFTLGEVRGEAKITPLAALARREAGSLWTRAAILSSLAEGAGGVFTRLAGDAAFRADPGGSEFLRQLAVLVGAQNRAEDVAAVLAFAKSAPDATARFQVLTALGDGLQRARQSLTALGEPVLAALHEAMATARSAGAPETARAAAAQLLAHARYAEAAPVLLELLDQNQPQAVQLAALMALGRFTDAQLGPELVRRLNALSPRPRVSAVELLLARADRARALLEGVQSGEIRPTLLDATQVKLLREHRDRGVRDLAAKVLSAPGGGARAAVIEQFLPALQLRGDAARGKKIYEDRCVSCHRAAGEGASLGPDFVTLKTTGREKILTNLIDPNAEVRPEFVGYVVETRDDETLMGLIVNETGTSITVRQAYGRETVVPRANILKMTSQGLSLMPEGLEAGLSAQDMADLLEFIESAGN
ncbi:MAG: c-type cytochrome [Verrucomicrobiales bacterium]|nr:c-type cytochrome [Verrucomicrobiales bacterium]